MNEQHTPIESSGTVAPPAGTALALVGEHHLYVERRGDEDVLRVEAPDGRLRVAVVVTPTGTTVELEGGDLAIHSSGEVAIDAERVSLAGRDGLSLSTDQDLEIHAGGVIRTDAHEQHLVARRGDLTVYANDDVKIAAERIKMNC